MTPDELLRNEAAKWLRQPAKDRNAAHVLLDIEPSRSVFLSQQAAEKAAKATSVRMGLPTMSGSSFATTPDFAAIIAASMIQSPAVSASSITPERARARMRSRSDSHPSGWCNRTARPLSLRSSSRKPQSMKEDIAFGLHTASMGKACLKCSM
jgi:hypothetical protein